MSSPQCTEHRACPPRALALPAGGGVAEPGMPFRPSAAAGLVSWWLPRLLVVGGRDGSVRPGPR